MKPEVPVSAWGERSPSGRDQTRLSGLKVMREEEKKGGLETRRREETRRRRENRSRGNKEKLVAEEEK